MKFLECSDLLELTSELTDLDLGDRTVSASVEAYSCKSTHPEKKLTKEIESKLDQNTSPNDSASTSAFSTLGPLSRASTRKLLVNLISTLNSSFPDYDFSNLSPDQFEQEQSHYTVINIINNQLLDTVEATNSGFKQKFWQTIDSLIHLDQCEIYCFVPEADSELFSVGKLWSLNYFFFNKNLKKIVFFTCSATSKLRNFESSQDAAQGQGWTRNDLTMVDELDAETAWFASNNSPLVAASPPPLALDNLSDI